MVEISGLDIIERTQRRKAGASIHSDDEMGMRGNLMYQESVRATVPRIL